MGRYKTGYVGPLHKTTILNHSARGRLNLAISCYKEMLDEHRHDDKYDKNGVIGNRYRTLLLQRQNYDV